MTPIIMPQIGQDSPRGQIVAWLKQENDPVAKGEVVLTVESEKAVFEVAADRDGVLLKILHPVGAQVEILQPVAYVGETGEVAPAGETPPSAATPAVAAAADGVPPGPIAPSAQTPPAFAVSPAVRRLARERQVDLAAVHGTGLGGRITLQDVEAAAAVRSAVTAGENSRP